MAHPRPRRKRGPRHPTAPGRRCTSHRTQKRRGGEKSRWPAKPQHRGKEPANPTKRDPPTYRQEENAKNVFERGGAARRRKSSNTGGRERGGTRTEPGTLKRGRDQRAHKEDGESEEKTAGRPNHIPERRQSIQTKGGGENVRRELSPRAL